MVSEIRPVTGDPFFARAAVLNSGSSDSGTTLKVACDAIYVGSTNASGAIVTFAQQSASVTLPGSMPVGVYPFSLTGISSSGGACGMNIVCL